jgi:hypothetical protein
MWYHDPGRLSRAWEAWGCAAWKPRYHVLVVPGLSGYIFNLTEAEDRFACVLAPLPRDGLGEGRVDG